MYQHDSSTLGKSVAKVYLKRFNPNFQWKSNFQLRSIEQGFPECERQKIKSRDHTPARHEGQLRVQHAEPRATLSPSRPGSALQESQFGESHCCHTATTCLQVMSAPAGYCKDVWVSCSAVVCFPLAVVFWETQFLMFHVQEVLVSGRPSSARAASKRIICISETTKSSSTSNRLSIRVLLARPHSCQKNQQQATSASLSSYLQPGLPPECSWTALPNTCWTLSLLKAVGSHITWFAPKPREVESQGTTPTFHPLEKMGGEIGTEWQCFQACAAAPCGTGQSQPTPKERTAQPHPWPSAWSRCFAGIELQVIVLLFP